MTELEYEKQLGLKDMEIKDKEVHITELEKENAELKLKLEALEGQTPWKDIKDKSEVIAKLTKAKEIIKGLLNIKKIVKDDKDYEVIAKAEQFISEVEK